MAVRVGINGFGRIGRNIMRAALGDKNIDFVAVNDLTNARRSRTCSSTTRCSATCRRRSRPRSDGISVDGDEFKVLSMRDPAAAALEGPRRRRRLRVDRALHQARRCGQAPRRRRQEGRHHRAGQEARTSRVVLGVNDEKYDPAKHQIISNASCTTNCLAPLAKVHAPDVRHQEGLDDDDPLLHERPAAARPAAQGPAARARGGAVDDSDDHRRGVAVGEVLPELKGKLDGFAMRVPTPNVSVVDLAAIVDKKTTGEEVNAALKEAADGRAQGHPAVLGRRARLDRLQGQPALVDRRRAVHEGHGRRFREGPVVVRQRVGLFEPLRRPAAAAGEEGPVAAVKALAESSPSRDLDSDRASASSSASTSTCRSRTA